MQAIQGFMTIYSPIYHNMLYSIIGMPVFVANRRALALTTAGERYHSNRLRPSDTGELDGMGYETNKNVKNGAKQEIPVIRLVFQALKGTIPV